MYSLEISGSWLHEPDWLGKRSVGPASIAILSKAMRNILIAQDCDAYSLTDGLCLTVRVCVHIMTCMLLGNRIHV